MRWRGRRLAVQTDVAMQTGRYLVVRAIDPAGHRHAAWNRPSVVTRAHVDTLFEECDLLALPAAARPTLHWYASQLTDWSIARFFAVAMSRL